jgi:hypothetical protein
LVHRVLPVVTLVTIAIVITMITGFFVLLGPLYFYYGFPIPWRLDYCPIVQPYLCAPIIWWASVIDVLFYTALEYILLLGYAKYRALRLTPSNHR